MSETRVNLYSEFDEIFFECEEDCPVVWIRAYNGPKVSLDLSADDRAALRAALNQADAIADKGDTK